MAPPGRALTTKSWINPCAISDSLNIRRLVLRARELIIRAGARVWAHHYLMIPLNRRSGAWAQNAALQCCQFTWLPISCRRHDTMCGGRRQDDERDDDDDDESLGSSLLLGPGQY